MNIRPLIHSLTISRLFGIPTVRPPRRTAATYTPCTVCQQPTRYGVRCFKCAQRQQAP